MADIVIDNLVKEYSEGDPVVKGFNLEIINGEFIVLVGPSGCGKSTTLRMIAGLEDITSGEIIIDGVLQNDLHPKDRDLAMVFQNYALYPHMDVYNNMGFGLKMRGVSKQEIDIRVKEAANLLQIFDFLDRKPAALSGGQRQRVALGRAIVKKPKVFLMDEPLSNLDAKLRFETRNQITNLHRDLEATTIYVTHDQTEAMSMADRIVILNDGIIQQVGSPTEVYEKPENIFVALFIGSPSMNIIDLKTISFNNQNQFYNHEIRKYADNVEDVLLGFRPEDVVIVDDSNFNNYEAVFSGRVINIEKLGATNLVYVETSGIQIIISSDSYHGLYIGKDIQYSLLSDKYHIFNKETGINLNK